MYFWLLTRPQRDREREKKNYANNKNFTFKLKKYYISYTSLENVNLKHKPQII